MTIRSFFAVPLTSGLVRRLADHADTLCGFDADSRVRWSDSSGYHLTLCFLDEISLRGAKGVLINITGGHDLTLFELDEAANRVREEVDPDANIIVGSTLDVDMEGMMRVPTEEDGQDETVHQVFQKGYMFKEQLVRPARVSVYMDED